MREDLLHSGKDIWKIPAASKTGVKPLFCQHWIIIEIRPKRDYRCKKYDVVLYKRGETYILPGIFRVYPNWCITAGDSNIFFEMEK